MGILEALEIEKLKPVQNGIYMCVFPEKKVFKLVKPEELPVLTDSGKTLSLGELIADFKTDISKLSEKNKMLTECLNKLISSHKKQIKVLKAQIIELQEERK